MNATAFALVIQYSTQHQQIARAFVNRIVCGMRKTKLNEKDQKIMDAMSEKSDEDGGFTVPQDIQTDIHELRRTDDDLEQYVNVEPVSTLSGSRVFATCGKLIGTTSGCP